MRALSLTQPWASITAAGLRDVISKTWKTDYRGQVLIVANNYRVPQSIEDELPLEWAMRISYAQETGLLEMYDDMPRNAILGYFTLEDIISDYEEDLSVPDSIWDEGLRYRWIIKDIVRFDSPILGAKARSNLFDIEGLNLSNLPKERHSPSLPLPIVEDGIMRMRISPYMLDDMIEMKDDGQDINFWFEDLPELHGAIYQSGLNMKVLKHVEKVVLCDDERRETFKVVRYANGLLSDEEGRIVKIPSYETGEDTAYPIIQFNLR